MKEGDKGGGDRSIPVYWRVISSTFSHAVNHIVNFTHGIPTGGGRGVSPRGTHAPAPVSLHPLKKFCTVSELLLVYMQSIAISAILAAPSDRALLVLSVDSCM